MSLPPQCRQPSMRWSLLAAAMQAAIDALEPVNAASVSPDADSAENSTSASTAAVAQSGLFAALAAAAAGMAALFRRKKHQER